MKTKILRIRNYALLFCIACSFFTVEIATAQETVQFESYNMPRFLIRHAAGRGRVDENINLVADSEFKLVAGLANSGAVSLQSVNFPGSYLRHKNGEIWLEANDGSAIFKNDATWWKRSGLASSAGVSFESYNFAGRYIRHRNYLLYSEAPGSLTADATFYQRSVTNAMVDVFEGADPEITCFDGIYRIYVTNQGGVIRCFRPYDNNNLKGSWYSTTAYTMPAHLVNGWAPAVVKVGSEYRMYFNARDVRGADDNNIYVAFSTNPNSGFANEVEVIHDNAGGCTDVIDVAIDGNYIYYGGSVGGGAFMADLTNNGRSSINHRRVNGLTNYSEAPFVGSVTGIGKVMLYARGLYYLDSYGTNWATGSGQNWTYRGQVNFPGADQYLFRLGHASTKNDWIVVNSNRAGTPIRRIAIGKLKLNGQILEGRKSTGENTSDAELTLTATIDEMTDVNVVADFGIVNYGELKVYPNPVENDFYIAFNTLKAMPTVQISIYDIKGTLIQKVIKENVENGVNSYQLNKMNLKTGQYIINVAGTGGTVLGNTSLIVK